MKILGYDKNPVINFTSFVTCTDLYPKLHKTQAIITPTVHGFSY